MPLTAAQFLRRFRALIVAAWAIPPIFGLGFLVLVVELFERGEVAAMFTTLPLPVFCVVALVGVSGEGKASVVVAVTDDLTDRFSAVDLVRVASSLERQR